MTLDQKDLTALICTRNGARTIGEAVTRCIADLERWTAGTGELIVVDNGSTDSTADIVKEAFGGSHIPTRLMHAPQPGKNQAFEVGVRAATGAIVCIIDDDNFVEPGFFQHVVSFFADYPEVGVIGADKCLDGSIEPPEWFESAKDHLACSRPPLEGDLAIDEIGREVADLGYIAGAGMSFRRQPFLRALDAGYSFFNDTVRGVKVTGEDIELCFLMRSMGFRFGYDPRMRLTHSLAAHRLTKQAFWALCEQVGAGSLGIDPFIFTTTRPHRPFPIRYSWQWQLLAKVRQLLASQFAPASQGKSPEQQRFNRKRERFQHWGAIRRIAAERSRYNAHIRDVAAGPWTYLRLK